MQRDEVGIYSTMHTRKPRPGYIQHTYISRAVRTTSAWRIIIPFARGPQINTRNNFIRPIRCVWYIHKLPQRQPAAHATSKSIKYTSCVYHHVDDIKPSANVIYIYIYSRLHNALVEVSRFFSSLDLGAKRGAPIASPNKIAAIKLYSSSSSPVAGSAVYTFFLHLYRTRQGGRASSSSFSLSLCHFFPLLFFIFFLCPRA